MPVMTIYRLKHDGLYHVYDHRNQHPGLAECGAVCTPATCDEKRRIGSDCIDPPREQVCLVCFPPPKPR